MDIIYLGHSAFKISGKNGTVVTDPFDPEMVGLKFPSVKADLVTISHDHKDHNRSDLVEGSRKVISGPGEYEVGGISIIGIGSYHDDKKGVERGKNTMYVIEMDSLRIAHLGDLGHKLTEEAVNKLGDIDILMVPVGGVFTIDAAGAVDVTRAIEPNIIIPMHYKMDGMNDSFTGLSPVDDFVKAIGTNKEELSQLKISQAGVNPDEQKLVVLNKK